LLKFYSYFDAQIANATLVLNWLKLRDTVSLQLINWVLSLKNPEELFS